MQPINRINDLLQRGNGIFFTSEAGRIGISRAQLSKMVENGILERTGRGVYIKAGGLDDDLYSLQMRVRKIVYSHETALYLYSLTDRTPVRYSITVPSGYKPSEGIKNKCKIYYIKPDLTELGKTDMPSGFGHQITTYNMERTICDILRSRSRIDSQIFTDALKRYSTRRDMDLNKLYGYASKLSVHKLLRQYLEVLL